MSLVKAGEGDFFSQEELDEAFEHVACVDVGDLPRPKGDLTPVYCPDEAQKGKFKIEDYIQGEPGAAATTLRKPLDTLANYLLELDCPINIWITFNCAGPRGDSENYSLAVLLYQAQVSNSTILGEAVAMGPDQEARVMTNAELSFEDRLLFYQIAFSPQALDNTAAANAIAFLPKTCESSCSAARALCRQGYMAMDGAMYNSEAKYTLNGGASWQECAADPFIYNGGDGSDVIVVPTATGHRAIFSRGSATAGEPAEVSITTDWGATWDNNDVGAVAAQFISHMFHLGGWIWAACSGGYIYRSKDLGETWTPLEAGVETGLNLRDIVMYSASVGYALGDTNTFLYTTDGEEFNARVGPAPLVNLHSVRVNNAGHVFVGAADGTLYVSQDEGVTWGARREFGAGIITRIKFDETTRYIGALTYNTGAPVGTTYRSHDGGATWQAPAGQVGAWNAGLNDVFVCDQNAFFVCGEVFDATTFVAKASK